MAELDMDDCLGKIPHKNCPESTFVQTLNNPINIFLIDLNIFVYSFHSLNIYENPEKH